MTEAQIWVAIAQLTGVGALLAAGGFYMLYRHEREKAAEAAEQSPPPAE